MSITARLVFSYSFSALGVLLVCCLFLYETLVDNLDREKLQFLADEIATLREVQTEHGESTENLIEEIQYESDAQRFTRYYVRIFEHGAPLLETASMAEILPPQVFPPAGPEHATTPEATAYVAPTGAASCS